MALLSAACSGKFEPYYRLESFRVLGVQAEPPCLAPNGSTKISALTYVPPGGSSVQYKWSWCPFTAGSEQGYACAVTQDQLQQAVDKQLGRGTIKIPSFELGTSSTATYLYNLSPAFYMGVCGALSMQNVPKGLLPPNCTSQFPIWIRLETASGSDAIVAEKTINLEYDASAANNKNPVLDGATYTLKDLPATPLPIDPGQTPPKLMRNTQYQLVLLAKDSISETYLAPSDQDAGPPVEKHEIISITWFVQGGSLDKTRTGFIYGETPSFSDALNNVWRTPKKVDYPDAAVHLAFVVRDSRGGTGWIERDVMLGD
jgi:hypothetical protein